MTGANDDGPTVGAADPSDTTIREGSMAQGNGGFSTEEVTAALRLKNASKNAALAAVAHATVIKAATGRLHEYLASWHDAHQDGHIEEARALALAISQVVGTMYRAGQDLDAAVMRQYEAQRQEAA